jgi:hypothetical protein
MLSRRVGVGAGVVRLPVEQQQRGGDTAAAAPPPMHAGSVVMVHGLRSEAAKKHNGRRGTVLRYDESKGRYAVQLQVHYYDTFTPTTTPLSVAADS